MPVPLYRSSIVTPERHTYDILVDGEEPNESHYFFTDTGGYHIKDYETFKKKTLDELNDDNIKEQLLEELPPNFMLDKATGKFLETHKLSAGQGGGRRRRKRKTKRETKRRKRRRKSRKRKRRR